MKKIILLLAILLVTMVLLCSCDCKHENLSQATCTTASICLDCGEIISATLGHTDGEWITDKEPNCTEDGSKHQVCSVCNDTIETAVISATGHTDGEWITDESATCTEDGSKHQVCSVCSDTIKTAVIPATGHTDGEWITDTNATCTEDGSKHQICSVCSDTIKTAVIPATGHTDGEWITDANATCTEDGSKHQVCSVCNDTIKTAVIPAAGHTDGEWITDANATCTEDGSKHQICSVCSDTIETAVIPATGHTDGEWITDANATCTEDGSKHQICSICNDTIKTAVIPATGHTDGEWITDANATCTENGSKHQICSVCNDTIKTAVIPATGHNHNKQVIPKDCLNTAKIVCVCENCNDTYEETINPITISLTHTGTGSSYSSSGYTYTRYYTITTNGGYGTIKIKYELFSDSVSSIPSSTMDFSSTKKVQITYGGDKNSINQKVYQITAKDEAGNISVYRFSLADESVISYSTDTHKYNITYNDSTDKLIHTCEYCGDNYTTSAEIVVLIVETFSQFDTAGFKEWSQINVGSSGGYGTLYYKYEVFSSQTSSTPMSHLTSDFSDTKDWYGVKSAITVNGFVIRVTVKDNYGHITVKRVLITNEGINILS